MEHQAQSYITTAAAYEAVQHSAEAIQHACEQRISADQKARTRQLGRIAQAHLALEPQAITDGLALYMTDHEAHDVAQAALFFSGTAHYDTVKLRDQLPGDVTQAVASFYRSGDTRDIA